MKLLIKLQTVFAFALCAALFPQALTAKQEVEFDAIEEKNLISGKDTLDPEKAYIYVKAPHRSNGLFVKTPDAADVSEYREYWDKRMDKAQRRYVSRKKSYDRNYPAWLKSGKRTEKPKKPIEPTPANLDADPIEQFMLVTFGPQFVYSKNTEDKKNKVFSYLIAVEPGEYSYYGPVFYIPNAQAMGTCYCMGTVRFEAKAGEVTSLGDLLALGWADDETFAKAFVGIDDLERPSPKPVDWSVPALLEEFGAVPADLRAARKINNFLGIRIARMPPYEGVLAYDRDRIIDLKSAPQPSGVVEVMVPPPAEAETETEVEAEAPIAPEPASEPAV